MTEHTQQSETVRLFIANLKIGSWSVKKHDRDGDRIVADANNIANPEDVGTFNKQLIEAAAFKPLQSAQSAARKAHNSMTAPWNDNGQRVLPAEMYFDYCETMKEYLEDVEEQARIFVEEEYPKQIEQARERLNGMFKASDYPSQEELRDRFTITRKLYPLPNPQDVRLMAIDDAAREELAAELENGTRQAIAEAQQALVEDLVTKAREFIEKVDVYSKGEKRKKKGTRNTLHRTAITNLTDLVGTILSGLNVTQDPALDELARELRDLFEDTDVSDLKGSNQRARDKKVNEVKETLDKFSGVFG